MNSKIRHSLLATTLLVGSVGVVSSAAAQEADANETSVSRTTSLPASVVEIGEDRLKDGGATSVEQSLNQLPLFQPAATDIGVDPRGGEATLNLRGLGEERTKVLVNGRYWGAFDERQVADVGGIPQFLLEKVSVATGAASVAYGRGGVAGTVDLRLRRVVNGIEAGASYGFTEETDRGDGAQFLGHIAGGLEFGEGRGFVTGYGQFRKRKGLLAADRLFSKNEVAEDRDADGRVLGETFIVGGSVSTNRGRIFIPGSVEIAGVNLNPCTGPGGTCSPTQDADFLDPGERAPMTRTRGIGSFNSFNGNGLGANYNSRGASDPFDVPLDLYKTNADNSLMAPNDRWTIGAYGEYEAAEIATVFGEFSFARSQTSYQLAPTAITATVDADIAALTAAGNLSAGGLATLRGADNNETAINNEIATRFNECAAAATPEMRAACQQNFSPLFGASAGPGMVQMGVDRRIVEAGNRQVSYERELWRGLVGVRGQFADNWDYEAYYLYSETRGNETLTGGISRSAFVTGVGDGSVNIFGPSTITSAMLANLAADATAEERFATHLVNATITGTVGNFGLGGEDATVRVGAEYQHDNARYTVNAPYQWDDIAGFGSRGPTDASINVSSAFGEIRVPIAANLPGIANLELGGSVRYSNYSAPSVGDAVSYAGTVTWAPVPDISFVAQYARVARAPSLGELYGGDRIISVAAADPCGNAGLDRSNAVRDLCVQTGVPAGAVFGGGVQTHREIDALLVSNPNLPEEKSSTYSLGVTLHPRILPRFVAAAQYFNVDIRNYIAQAGGGVASQLSNCYYLAADIASSACQAIIRDPNSGAISGSHLGTAALTGVGRREMSGIDLRMAYTVPLRFGIFRKASNLDLSFIGTWTEKDVITPNASERAISKDCAGLFGLLCRQVLPEYKWNARLSWQDGPVATTVSWQHQSSVKDDNDKVDYLVEELGAADYINVDLSFGITRNLNMGFGVNNLLNTMPRVLGGNQLHSNTYTGTYDVLGRRYYLSTRLKF